MQTPAPKTATITAELIAKMAEIPFRDLFGFWALARLGHGPTAAEAIGMTPDGLGCVIHRLQVGLKVKLFINNPRGRKFRHRNLTLTTGGCVVPTPAGRALLRRINPLFVGFAGAICAIRAAD